MIEGGAVVDYFDSGFALRVLCTEPTGSLINIADTLFSGIYPSRSTYHLHQGTGGAVFAVLEDDLLMKKLDQRRIMVKHGDNHFKLGLVRVPIREIVDRTGPCIFRRLN
jgi:hypothetical protein